MPKLPFNSSNTSNPPAYTLPVYNSQAFTANGTWTAPTGSWRFPVVYVTGLGGGGGGGSGQGGTQGAAGVQALGGAGGGAALAIHQRPFDNVPLGTVFTITIGSGGLGGINQGDGLTSTVSAISSGTVGGDTIVSSNSYLLVMYGGGAASSSAGTTNGGLYDRRIPSPSNGGMPMLPGNGGGNFLQNGSNSKNGQFLGGLTGSTGGSISSGPGGLPGGGGGASDFGAGGASGNGGTSTSGGNSLGTAGVNGSGYGSGGGGGGGGGVGGASTLRAGGNGGNGMPGYVLIEWYT